MGILTTSPGPMAKPALVAVVAARAVASGAVPKAHEIAVVTELLQMNAISASAATFVEVAGSVAKFSRTRTLPTPGALIDPTPRMVEKLTKASNRTTP